MLFDGMNKAAPYSTCKCCAKPSALCGLTDFSRGGADHLDGYKVDPYFGTSIYYYRCEQCGFIHAPAFDDWTPNDFSEHIYNAAYERQDLDYTFARPNANAQMIAEFFPGLAQEKLLDYGAGQGFSNSHFGFAGSNEYARTIPLAKRPTIRH
ncbi:hypothetical protein YK56LOC_08740 [Caballeronia sp. HLA56]